MLIDKDGVTPRNCIFGSVAANGWFISEFGGWINPGDTNFKSLSQAPPEAPFFFDCRDADIWPEANDTPQEESESDIFWRNDINYATTNRHYGNISVVFWDGSCTNVGLKSLWRLKWHEDFDTRGTWSQADAEWPEWMDDFKDPRDP